jgi:tRNA threonylcarbamoyladenosine biosynthesis protein TsaE
MEMISHSVEETDKVARVFVEKLKSRPDSATIVCLFGDLGSGKTTFVQAVARALGVNEPVQSPTFVIEKIYKLSTKHFNHMVHIDAYRLKSGKELMSLGWSETAADKDNVIFIEWAEQVKEILPKKPVEIYFEHISENERKIKIIHG